MPTIEKLIVDVLVRLVDSVPDEPRRVLFRGVSAHSAAFRARVAGDDLRWEVLVTGENVDVVGTRNNPSIAVLVVFYRDDVRERESLNAFRQFDADSIADALVRLTTEAALPGIESYTLEEARRLRGLLGMVYPSVENLAAFVLQGKANVGLALPQLGLFADPVLSYDLNERQWYSRLRDNHLAAVLRWREFLEKVRRNSEARRQLGKERVSLLQQADLDPQYQQQVLERITFLEAVQIFNPPTRLVAALMRAGMLRERAEWLVQTAKAGTQSLDRDQLPADIPDLPEETLKELRRIAPVEKGGTSAVEEEDSSIAGRVNFCLEAALRLSGLPTLSGESWSFPSQLRIVRDDVSEGASALLTKTANGAWTVAMSAADARLLSVPATGANELLFKLVAAADPSQVLLRFSLETLANRLETFAEQWPPEEFWDGAATLDTQMEPAWRRLQSIAGQLRDVVDPNWRQEHTGDEAAPEREPNNAIYAIFDLLYLAHRDLFEAFQDSWLEVATLPWRANIAADAGAWRRAMEQVLQLGTALGSGADGAVAVLPFHPLRLAWHRAVITQIEGWLTSACAAEGPLAFEPSVLAHQLQPVDRPAVVFRGMQRLVESSTAPFFSIFIPEQRHQRERAPLYRAQQKLDQFGRMWPFSMARLHIAFQPGDAGHHIYRLLSKQAANMPDAAYRVRAVVDGPTVPTWFDRQLLATGDNTTDLLTQEHHESLLPRIDYAKGLLDDSAEEAVTAHVALLVDAFREERYGFKQLVGQLNPGTHWQPFQQLARTTDPVVRRRMAQVSLSAPPYHSGEPKGGRRDLVYVPLSDEPEYLRMLVDSLTGWVHTGEFGEAVYYEQVRWDAESIVRLHNRTDWVILFDRTIDRSLFQKELQPSDVKLIDFYPNLPGGYRLSVSSRRIDAVRWQLAQVLGQFFDQEALDLRAVADEMLNQLVDFASGLLLKTLGGGSLAQELLGLYATYRALIADGILDPANDWLIPLDNYQNWFGRRTQRGRRADLLVLREVAQDRLEMLAVESKWYKDVVGEGFVADELGPNGQLRTAVASLRSLFDPAQERLDRDYWQRTLRTLLDEAPARWKPFCQRLNTGQWNLEVDGIVYVHQYADRSADGLRAWTQHLNTKANGHLGSGDTPLFGRGPNFERVRLRSYQELVALFAGSK